jgi:hypothetical protein
MAHSTVAPHTMRAAAEIVQRRGAQLLDAPFTGSKGAAEKGELVYYIGGDDAAYRRARPILQASSKEIIEIGEIGEATTIKIATNMITAATVQVAAEALALVHHAGLPLEKFAVAMRGNGSNSGTLTMKLPKMLEGDFDPHFSVKHMLKDVEIASRMARSYGLPLPATEAARDSLVEEVRRGRADSDYSSIVQTFFPNGVPMKAGARPQKTEEQQATLSGLEHQETPSARREPETAQPELEPEEARIEIVGEETVNVEERVAAEPAHEPEKLPTAESELDGSARSEDEAPPTDAHRNAPNEPLSVDASVGKDSTPTGSGVAEPRGFLSRLFGKGVDY